MSKRIPMISHDLADPAFVLFGRDDGKYPSRPEPREKPKKEACPNRRIVFFKCEAFEGDERIGLEGGRR